jgi:hypothetical protein
MKHMMENFAQTIYSMYIYVQLDAEIMHDVPSCIHLSNGGVVASSNEKRLAFRMHALWHSKMIGLRILANLLNALRLK